MEHHHLLYEPYQIWQYSAGILIMWNFWHWDLPTCRASHFLWRLIHLAFGLIGLSWEHDVLNIEPQKWPAFGTYIYIFIFNIICWHIVTCGCAGCWGQASGNQFVGEKNQQRTIPHMGSSAIRDHHWSSLIITLHFVDWKPKWHFLIPFYSPFEFIIWIL